MEKLFNVTLDTNCIIDLENENHQARFLKPLIKMHNNRKINLRVVAISASEQKPDQTYSSHINEFKCRLHAIDLDNVEILPTILYCGLGFSGHSLTGGGRLDELERKIQKILFPFHSFTSFQFVLCACIDKQFCACVECVWFGGSNSAPPHFCRSHCARAT